MEFVKNRKAVPIVRDGKKAITTADTMSPDGIQARLDELQKELIKKANRTTIPSQTRSSDSGIRRRKPRPTPARRKKQRSASGSCRSSFASR